MEQNIKIEKILKQFKINPCLVKLDRVIFSKINIRCTEVNLQCDMKQENRNTFSIKIKRKINDHVDEIDEANPKKKVKFSSPIMQTIAVELPKGNTFDDNTSCDVFKV